MADKKSRFVEDYALSANRGQVLDGMTERRYSIEWYYYTILHRLQELKRDNHWDVLRLINDFHQTIGMTDSSPVTWDPQINMDEEEVAARVEKNEEAPVLELAPLQELEDLEIPPEEEVKEGPLSLQGLEKVEPVAAKPIEASVKLLVKKQGKNSEEIFAAFFS